MYIRQHLHCGKGCEFTERQRALLLYESGYAEFPFVRINCRHFAVVEYGEIRGNMLARGHAVLAERVGADDFPVGCHNKITFL